MPVAGRFARFGRPFAVPVLALSLSACAGLGLGSKPPPAYDLTAPHPARVARAARGQLVIPEPTAIAVLDSERIVVRPAPDEIATLADAQWMDRLPKLLQARLVTTFENARRLRAVGRPGDRITADYELVTDVRAFQLSVSSGAEAQVEIAAKIVAARSGRIVAARVFRAVVPSDSTQAPGAVRAIDEAFGEVAVHLVRWVTRVI